MFLFLENSKAERLVVGIKGSSLAIYYLNGNISIKDDFLPHYINYVKNHSPYAGGVLEFNDRQLITFFGKSQNYNSTWNKFIFDEAKNVLKRDH